MPELLAAAAVGVSFSNTWLCMLMSFGCGSDNVKVGVRFILGRFVGLLIIGVAISAIGAITDIPPIYFVVIFGVASIIFGALMVIGLYTGHGGRFHGLKRAIRHSLGLCKKDEQSNGVKGSKGAFVVGVLRGATPCVKLMVLAPLLIYSGPVNAIALVLVYALASTIYPLIGFLTASALTTLPKYERAFKLVGATVLIFAGIYAIVNESIMFLAPGGA
jgi:cytochrome c biogenesis protein CcdA